MGAWLMSRANPNSRSMPNTRDSRAGGSSARSSGPALRAVLLDIDGTLIDSNDAHARAWVDAGAELGYRIQYEDVRPLIGMGGDKVMPQLRKLDDQARSLKAEIATLNVRLASTEPSRSAGDFAHLAEIALESW